MFVKYIFIIFYKLILKVTLLVINIPIINILSVTYILFPSIGLHFNKKFKILYIYDDYYNNLYDAVNKANISFKI